MIVSGGIGANTWQVSSTDHTNPAGCVLKRTVRIEIGPDPITSQDACRLATAIRLVAKNGATH
jgi:hypothetical protein